MTGKDSVIVLAWPQTPAKAIGVWYDHIAKLFGYIKNGYYAAGHGGSVIVDHKKKELHYFDFGRYHMPVKYGRARDKKTDPRLNITTQPEFSADNKLVNIKEILLELSNNKVCHGKGPLYGTVLENVSFELAYKYAKGIQNRDAVVYGPYNLGGTNCSRFITSIAKNSNPGRRIKFHLSFSFLLTPLTKANVLACNDTYYRVLNNTITINKVTIKEQLKNFMFPLLFKKRPNNKIQSMKYTKKEYKEAI